MICLCCSSPAGKRPGSHSGVAGTVEWGKIAILFEHEAFTKSLEGEYELGVILLPSEHLDWET